MYLFVYCLIPHQKDGSSTKAGALVSCFLPDAQGLQGRLSVDTCSVNRWVLQGEDSSGIPYLAAALQSTDSVPRASARKEKRPP